MARLILIFTLIVFIPTEATGLNFDMTELDTLVKLANDTELEIEEWQITIKETVEREKLYTILDEMKETQSITTIKNDKTTKYLIKKSEKTTEVSETYTIIIPHAENQSGELIVVNKGSSWGKSTMDKYQGRQMSTNSHYFTAKAKTFTCLSIINHGIIKDVDFFSEMKQQLGLKYVSTQFDSIEHSIHKETFYGYTNQWNEKLVIDNKPLNLQMVIQSTDNGKSKIIIGTPILINEY